MKIIKLENIDIEIFKNAFLSFKKIVPSDFEFNFDHLELSTSLEDFDKYNLVTLAKFYGAHIFRKKNELEIVEFQLINISFNIDYNLPKITFKSEWGDNIELDAGNLYSADLFLTNKLVQILSNNSKQLLKDNLPDFEQTVSFNSNKYAYFITGKTLVLIQTDKNKAKITHLFKIKWNEV